MHSKIYNWSKSLWGKITAFIVTAVALMTFIDFLLKWKIYSYFLNIISLYFSPIFVYRIVIPIYFLSIIIIILLSFILLFIRDNFKKEKYFIPVRDKFYTGFEPSSYDRKTNWKFKRVGSYYFVPLLSHSYNSVEFVDLCGPYCSKCNHVLHVDGGNDMGSKFFCVNCVEKYKIPAELLGDYQNKLLAYFRDEYRQGRLKDSNR